MKIVMADLGHSSLKPLTYTRASTDLEIGGKTVFEHVNDELNTEEASVLVPDYLEEITRKNSELYDLDREVNTVPEEVFLLYNSTVIPSEEIKYKIGKLEKDQALFHNGKFLAGLTDRKIAFNEIKEVIEEFERKRLDKQPIVIEYSWDMIDHNGELIEKTFPEEEINGELSDEAEVEGDEGLYIGEDAVVQENTVIDTSEGPVIIDSGSKIWPNSRIEGPAYIGEDTKIGAGENAVVHENTHIGDVTRIGGELEESIVNSFTNKYHYGFLGHAVVGSWVNFGAGTTNSDLKNTYGIVKVDHPEEGIIESGMKTGATIGDHTKLDIQTGIYTGKQIGPVSRASGKVTENIEPFIWQHLDEKHDYRLEKSVEHIERMMRRRKDHLPEGYVQAQKNLLRELYERIDS